MTWQSDEFRRKWMPLFEQVEGFDPSEHEALIQRNREQGVVKRDSRFIRGVTDVAAPIFRGGLAAASLVSPCIQRLDSASDPELPIDLLKTIADRISNELQN